MIDSRNGRLPDQARRAATCVSAAARQPGASCQTSDHAGFYFAIKGADGAGGTASTSRSTSFVKEVTGFLALHWKVRHNLRVLSSTESTVSKFGDDHSINDPRARLKTKNGMQHSSNRSSASWRGPELLEALWTIFVRKLSMNDEVGVLAPNRITVDNELLRVGHGTFPKAFYHCGGQRP